MYVCVCTCMYVCCLLPSNQNFELEYHEVALGVVGVGSMVTDNKLSQTGQHSPTCTVHSILSGTYNCVYVNWYDQDIFYTYLP